MSDLLTLSPGEFCRVTEACEGGRAFALQYASMAEVWDRCPRVDWLLWITNKVGQRPDDRTLRLFAIWCARNTPLGDGRVTGDLLTDPRSLAALEVAERYAHGQATAEELSAAEDAAWAAAWDAKAAPWNAARDAAWAAKAAPWAAAQAAAEDAWDATRAAQADQLRRMVPNPFRAKEGQP